MLLERVHADVQRCAVAFICKHGHQHGVQHRHGGEFASSGANKHYAPDLTLEPVHLDIALHVDLEAERAVGTVTHTLRANVAGAKSITLHGVDLDDVTVDDEGVQLAYDDKELTLLFESPFALGEERQVAIHYRVTHPASGLFFSKPAAHNEGGAWFAATDHETERARHWLPTIDLPAVRPTLAFHLRADARFTILANGRLEREEQHDDGTKTAHYVLPQRCPSYLTCFAIGDFIKYDGGEHHGVPVAAYTVKPWDADSLERSFAKTREMLDWMTAKLGVPFPYPKYSQFAVPGIGGAMENISLVSWDDRFIMTAPLASEEQQLVDVVNVHEMAHTWFGDLVVCRDYGHAWLKESWATYMEACWLEDHLGADAFQHDLYVCAEKYIGEVKGRYVRPIVTRRFDSSWDMYDYHLYPGGAMRLHMLRRMLGDGIFWEGVRTYLEENAQGVVETIDFQRALERASGRSLGRFFDQWIFGKGYPDLKVSFRYDATAATGTYVIEQRQVDAKKGVGLFEFPLVLAWTIGGKEQRETVTINRRKAVFTFKMSMDPATVQVDPDGDLMHGVELDVGDRRLRLLLKKGNARGRMQAGASLAKTGKRRNVQALAEAFETEPFWGVRAEWAKSLGRNTTLASLDVLLKLAEAHEDAESLAAVMSALGKFRDERVSRVVVTRLAKGLPPRATEAAYLALGAQRENAKLDALIEGAQTETPTGFPQGGAIRALAETRLQGALETLSSLASPSATPERVRASVMTSLGSLAKTLPNERPREHAIELMVDGLRDPNPRVRIAAARALSVARASQAANAVEAYRATLPAQEQVRVGRLLKTIRSGRGQRKDKRVEELLDRVRKLDDRIEKLEAKKGVS